jgi:hydrogenase 3 maturation protease
MTPRAAWKRRLALELGRPERLVVLGVGNPARADDGAGTRCVRALTRRARGGLPRLKVIDGRDVPENSTGRIREFAPSHVLIVDAAAAGHRPGTVHLVDQGLIAEDDLSTHRIPLTALTAFLRQTIGCRVTVLGIEPGRLCEEGDMTPAVARAADALAAWLAGFARRRLRSSSASRRRCS